MKQIFNCALALVSAVGCGGVARSQTLDGCTPVGLPAYSHNDYENSRPLADAVENGFRGVEADVFLVDGLLRLGHDRRAAQRGRDFEEVYLKPLRERISRCGALISDGTPFLLAVELKEDSPAAYARLLVILDRYRDLIIPSKEKPAGEQSPVEVILVGWHPSPATLRQERDGLVRIQQRLTRPEDSQAIRPNAWVVLYSVDYGKTLGRRGITKTQQRRWLEGLRQVKSAAPHARLRVHNVPTDGALYSALLKCGVDLIGTKDLRETRRLLGSDGPERTRDRSESADGRVETSTRRLSLTQSCT